MADVTATGCLSEPLADLRSEIAEWPTWQTWTGTTTAAQAKTRIYIGPVVAWSYPCISIMPEKEGQDVEAEFGQPPMLRSNGSLHVFIASEVPETYRAPDQQTNAAIWFLNQIGAMLQDYVDRRRAGSGCTFWMGRWGRCVVGRTLPEQAIQADGTLLDLISLDATIPYSWVETSE
jgi:hypothetical protein